jgi:predicted ATPase
MPVIALEVSNFKSFRHLEVHPLAFSIVIGSNASGKSNFIQIFKFIRDISKYGLSNAISLQGGVEYLRNMIIGTSEDFSFRIVYALEEKKEELIGVREGMPLYFTPTEILYEFALRFTGSGEGFEIISDNLVVTGDFGQQSITGVRLIGPGTMQLTSSEGEILYRVHTPPDFLMSDEDVFPHLFQKRGLSGNRLIVNTPMAIPGIPALEWIFRGMKVYDFDPKLLKKAVPIMGKTELEKDGSNIAIVVKNIIEDPGKKVIFENLIKDVLPFVDDVAVEKFMDLSLFLKMREVYSRGIYLPGSMISDGTINILALIIALYFEERPVTIIEEPERNIHPYLISRVVAMLKEASTRKQIIVTTHNPELVKHVELDDILLISRDKSGFSEIMRPANRLEIRTFLDNEIGIEDLFVQNLLGME